MRMFLCLWLAVCGIGSAQLTPVPPPPMATPSHPFFIVKTWIIGGVGNWDYMAMDPQAQELFISHGPNVQVVNVETGTVAGIVRGLREAHAIVLDPGGTYAYVSDGPVDVVRVFDRRTFQIVANIPSGPSPRSMALDPASGLLFVVGSQVSGVGQRTPATRTSNQRPAGSRETDARTAPIGGPQSTITVIDVQQRTQLAQIALSGSLGFAQADGDGHIYVTVADRNRIIRLDAQAVGNAVHKIIDSRLPAKQPTPAGANEKALLLDWTTGVKPAPPADAYPTLLFIDGNCDQPRSLAFDSAHQRLFVACSNFRMVVLNAGNGQGVATVPIGPGADAIGYDPNRGLIYTANGGGDGSLTIVRQDVTDTYSVVQTLPTRQHARTLAINPSNGNVYLTSVIYGAALSTPFTNGSPAQMRVAPVDSSFQVLVVGN